MIRACCRVCGSLFITPEPVQYPSYCPVCIKSAAKPVARKVPKPKPKPDAASGPANP